MSFFEFDLNISKNKTICGVDEAGRGPLAGPVVAAAVVLEKNAKDLIFDVNDSKKLSEKKREDLYDRILNVAKDFSVGIVSAKKIDEINILNATMEAMKKAVCGLKIKPEIVLVDGNRVFDCSYPIRCIVKGDQQSASIAAASIVAKVTRDNIMKKLDEKYDKYFFKNNKGYGTKKHYESIIKYGITPEHRKTFLKNLKEKKFKIQNISGKMGEKICYGWLLKNGYEVICKNYKSEFGEIDLIALKENYICFIEVKLRQADCGYCPSDAVDRKKQRKIIKTAYVFNEKHNNKYQPKFVVMEVLRDKYLEFKVNFIDDAFYVEDENKLFIDDF